MPNIKSQAGKNKETAKKAAARTKTSRKEEAMTEAAAEEQAIFAAPVGAKEKTSPKEAPAPKEAAHEAPAEEKPAPEIVERIFALDIGTRSVIGVVADRDTEGTLHIVGTHRQEHITRAMLDGQIHDVPQVAAIIEKVKGPLDEKYGPLRTAAVAAAGRALYTMTAEAEMVVNGIITAQMQQDLDFAGVQAAQKLLADSQTLEDPTRYYCVGYSTVRYILDDIQLKSLIGQRGKKAKAVVIATFLPRQVIDSMQSALHAVSLEMRALTLEPIAAINVLIPPTMRHLNLVLVDIGAGTSDVAITKNGSVTAYGMVPLAGDEITEAISQKFLLDFNVAEYIKRQAAKGENVSFTDILGMEYNLTAEEVIEPILPNVENLAKAITKQILELNSEAPQAVMLVGGGSLTPHLQEYVAESLDMPISRVAVRHPDKVVDMEGLPEELQKPDAVTPLGILQIASQNTLHFLTVYVNNEEYSLFNFRDLTITDALLNAGISLKKYNGRPGLGLMVSLGGERKSFPGTMGSLAKVTLDGEDATLDTIIRNGSRIGIVPGKDGFTPEIYLGDLVTGGQEYTVYINGRENHLRQKVTVNGEESAPDRQLKDGDVIENREFKSLGEALQAAGYPPQGRRINYKLNGAESTYTCTPEILLDDTPATISQPIHEGDHIDYIPHDEPKLGDVLKLKDTDTALTIYYEGKECKIPTGSLDLTVNGRKASLGTILDDGCEVRYQRSAKAAVTVSDALLAVNFNPPSATSRVSFTILVNGQPVDFTDPVKNGDTLEVKISPLGSGIHPPTSGLDRDNPHLTDRGTNAPKLSELNSGLPKTQLTIADFIRHD